jgi:hypothetical protein
LVRRSSKVSSVAGSTALYEVIIGANHVIPVAVVPS